VRRLARHDLTHSDGRRVLVYGSLAEDAELASVESSVGNIHRRRDLLTGDWVVISPKRNVRPLDHEADDDHACPVCPGGLELPFVYEAAVFENRYPSLVAEPPLPEANGPCAPALGRCEVVVYTPRHDTSFGALTPDELGRLLAIWTDRSRELWADERHELVLVFENRGAEAGATLSHPHGQIYAFDHLPPLARQRAEAHIRHREHERCCLGCEVVSRDSASVRGVADNGSFVAAVPFAPRWPYEVHVRARRHGLQRLSDLRDDEQVDLIAALRSVALRYDALHGRGTPYLLAAQEAPRGQADWHLAFELYPLRRTAAVSKVRASVETATGLFLNDVLPEDAADALRGLAVDEPPIRVEHLCRVAEIQPVP
jgi:UDPglucose--hexose-1-phosphate uridylyltransferase